jgi:hypothetical protein
MVRQLPCKTLQKAAGFARRTFRYLIEFATFLPPVSGHHYFNCLAAISFRYGPK